MARRRALVRKLAAGCGFPVADIDFILFTQVRKPSIELIMAGASAVQVGTATFADPRSVGRVAADVESWCRRHGVATLTELIGVARAR